VPQQTTMTFYQDVVLECQHCYMICRYVDAAVRHNCPACGRAIANWTELAAMREGKCPPSPEGAPASTGEPSPPSQP
jgi:predicted RNA-binding Zn-ribbon protein involved in translation (DUF1610 family)